MRLDFYPQGSVVRQRLRFATLKQAKAFEASVRVKVIHKEYTAPKTIPTFGAVADEWLTSKRSYHPSTHAYYRTMRNHLQPLDKLRLDQISVEMIERLAASLVGNGRVSPDAQPKLRADTVRRVLTVASAIFRGAMRKQPGLRNPVELAERPRATVRELRGGVDEAKDGSHTVQASEVFSQNEIARLLAAADAGLWRTCFALVASTGIRGEEAGALQWTDVELAGDTAQIVIRRSLSLTRAHDEIGRIRPKYFKPKTRAGFRSIPLPQELLPMLREWKLACPPTVDGLVFCQPNGRPLDRGALWSAMNRACRKAGLRALSLKNLRHSFASGLVGANVPITEVAHLMGHSSPAISLRVYSHFVPSASTGGAQAFAAGFLGSKREPYRSSPL